jgi:V-type H+-transporting ATPase subunit a
MHHQICDAFNANRYPFPDDLARQRQMLTEVTSRLRELHTTNEAGERRREAVVNEIARGLEGWTTLVRREKATFHIMNKLSLDVTCKVRAPE